MNITGLSGSVVPGPESNKEDVDIKALEKWNFFFKKLLSAIDLVGGMNDSEYWRGRTIEEVYKTLSPNGIALTFRIDSNKIHERVFGDRG